MEMCRLKLLLLLSLLLRTYVSTKSIQGLQKEEADNHPHLVSFRISEDEQIVWCTFSDKRMAQAALVKEDKECIFNGKFTNDGNSRILVTGCKGDERNIMIRSNMYGDSLAIGRNGSVQTVKWNNDYRLQNAVNNQHLLDKNVIVENFMREKRSNSDLRIKNLDSENKVLPDVLHLPLQIYLAPSWRTKFFPGVHKAKEVLSFVKSFFLDSSLDTKFNLTFSNSDIFNTHVEWTPSRLNLDNLPKYISAPLSGRAAIVYVAASFGCVWKNTGYSNLASICDKDKKKPLSMCCWYNSTITTAQIVAHEIGHILGFYHDFEPERNPVGPARTRTCGPGKSYGGPTNKLMNYNWDKVNSWSSCSNEDFKNYFNRITNQGPFCLKEKTKSIITTPTTVTSTTKTTTTATPTTTFPTTTAPTTKTPMIKTPSTTTLKTLIPTHTTLFTTTISTTTSPTTSISENSSHLNAWSIFGTILLVLGIIAFGLAGCKSYKPINLSGMSCRKYSDDSPEFLLTGDDNL